MKSADQKTIVVGVQSAAALWASFAAETKEQEPPAGAMTAREFADRFEIPLESARATLARAVSGKKMTATPVKRITGGQKRTVIYYTPKA